MKTLMMNLIITTGLFLNVAGSPDCLYMHSPCPAPTTQSKIDSFKLSLLKLEDTPEKVRIYNNIASEYKNTHIDSALSYVNKAIELALEINYKEGLAYAYNFNGILYKNAGEYVKAIDIYEQCYKIYLELNNYEGIASYYNNIGNIYKRIERNDEALKFYLRSFYLFTLLGEKEKIASPANNIGTMYEKKNYNDSALYYYNTSLSINRELNDSARIGYCYINIGEL